MTEQEFKEKFKIEVPEPWFEGFDVDEVTLSHYAWQKLLTEIHNVNCAIDEAPVLKGQKNGSFGPYKDPNDTYMCLGLGIQPIEPDSKDKLIRDLASKPMLDFADEFKDRAKKLLEKERGSE